MCQSSCFMCITRMRECSETRHNRIMSAMTSAVDDISHGVSHAKEHQGSDSTCCNILNKTEHALKMVECFLSNMPKKQLVRRFTMAAWNTAAGPVLQTWTQPCALRQSGTNTHRAEQHVNGQAAAPWQLMAQSHGRSCRESWRRSQSSFACEAAESVRNLSVCAHRVEIGETVEHANRPCFDGL